jgi:hypothetical protein
MNEPINRTFLENIEKSSEIPTYLAKKIGSPANMGRADRSNRTIKHKIVRESYQVFRQAPSLQNYPTYREGKYRNMAQLLNCQPVPKGTVIIRQSNIVTGFKSLYVGFRKRIVEPKAMTARTEKGKLFLTNLL